MFNFTKITTAVILIGAGTVSHAAEYWISKKGNDANNCASASTSCLSIQKGLNLLKAGDILNIDEGTYVEDSTNSAFTSKCGLLDADYGSLCVKSSGTESSPITIRALPGKEGKVIIDSEGKRAGIIISKQNYIHIRNLTFINSRTGGIATPGGPASTTAPPRDEILSIGCVIAGNSILNTTGGKGINVSAIYMWSTKDWIVMDNIIKTVVSDDAAWDVNGIQTYGTINARISHNSISDVDIGINWKDHYIPTPGEIYQESLIDYNFLSVKQTGVRISIRADGSNPAGNNQIKNNVIELLDSSSVAIAAYLAGATGLSEDLDVTNNLFIGRSSDHTGINADSVKKLRFYKNVFANMTIAFSTRYKSTDRRMSLVGTDMNVYDMNFKIILDRYQPDGSAKEFRDLAKWRVADPVALGLDTVAIQPPKAGESPSVQGKDKLSIQYNMSAILATPIGTTDYKSLMPMIGNEIVGPYNPANSIIGPRPANQQSSLRAREALPGAPAATQSPLM